jgi:hypothetical protein
MRKRLPFIPQRRPIFVGCEGESESGYVGLLQDLIREASLPVHLLVADLGIGAGDPLTRIEMAARKLEQLRRTRTALTQKFVLLDSDQAEADRVRAAKTQRLATQHGIQIIWQRPCFEAVLLRHLPACASRRPPDTPEAERSLLREWPDYKKPMSRAELSKRITLNAVLQAAGVEPELKLFLKGVGLIE